MAQTSRVDWYVDQVCLAVDGASERMLAGIAHQIEGQAKINIQVNGQIDTGFMLNSVYSVTPQESNYGLALAAARSRNPDGEMAPEQTLPAEAGAAVVAGAEYAVFQETRRSFLYRALEQVAGEVGGVIQQVGREAFGG